MGNPTGVHKTKKPFNLPPEAYDVLNECYDECYKPHDDQIMVYLGRIQAVPGCEKYTIKQLRIWFANNRLRRGHTKHPPPAGFVSKKASTSTSAPPKMRLPSRTSKSKARAAMVEALDSDDDEDMKVEDEEPNTKAPEPEPNPKPKPQAQAVEWPDSTLSDSEKSKLSILVESCVNIPPKLIAAWADLFKVSEATITAAVRELSTSSTPPLPVPISQQQQQPQQLAYPPPPPHPYGYGYPSRPPTSWTMPYPYNWGSSPDYYGYYSGLSESDPYSRSYYSQPLPQTAKRCIAKDKPAVPRSILPYQYQYQHPATSHTQPETTSKPTGTEDLSTLLDDAVKEALVEDHITTLLTYQGMAAHAPPPPPPIPSFGPIADQIRDLASRMDALRRQT